MSKIKPFSHYTSFFFAKLEDLFALFLIYKFYTPVWIWDQVIYWDNNLTQYIYSIEVWYNREYFQQEIQCSYMYPISDILTSRQVCHLPQCGVSRTFTGFSRVVCLFSFFLVFESHSMCCLLQTNQSQKNHGLAFHRVLRIYNWDRLFVIFGSHISITKSVKLPLGRNFGCVVWFLDIFASSRFFIISVSSLKYVFTDNFH